MNKPVHIITLTRVPIDNESNPRTEDRDYSPIAVTEATTVFELTNFLLGGKYVDSIEKAHKFDRKMFLKLQEIDEELKTNLSFKLKTARSALAVEPCILKEEDIQNKILSMIQSGKDINIEKTVIVLLKDSINK